jgi:hypothetical protein
MGGWRCQRCINGIRSKEEIHEEGRQAAKVCCIAALILFGVLLLGFWIGSR